MTGWDCGFDDSSLLAGTPTHTQKERLTDPKSSSPTQRGCPRSSFLPPLTSLCTDKSQSWRQRLLTHPDEAHWSWRLEVKQQLTLRHLLFLSPSERYTLLPWIRLKQKRIKIDAAETSHAFLSKPAACITHNSVWLLILGSKKANILTDSILIAIS